MNLQKSVDILLVSESHLTPRVSNATVNIPGFEILRNDSGDTAKHGVCAFVRRSIQVDCVDASHPNVLSFRLVMFDIFVLVVYRPPSNTQEQNDALTHFLIDSCAEKEAIIAGDFNLPSLDWSNTQMIRSASPADLKFVNTFDTLGLTQWITVPTFPLSSNMLDLLLMTDPDRIGTVSMEALPPGCDHCSIHCDYIFDTDVHVRAQASQRYAWHRGNYPIINRLLQNIDWDYELDQLSPNAAFVKLKDILEPLIVQYIPLCKHTENHRLPWSRNPPTSLKNQRKHAWEEYKDNRSMHGRHSAITSSSLQSFLQANKALRNFAFTSQVNYERSLIARTKDNPRLLHSYIRHKKQYRSSVGPIQVGPNSTTDDPKEMADCFLHAFASVFSTGVSGSPAKHQTCPDSVLLDGIDFTLDDVGAVLNNLDPNSSMGPDGLHPQLLKSCSETLAYPLHKIFQISLKEGSLPQEWKTSIVIPIFKKGSRYDPLNYRPVSLTSVPGKCLERLVCQEVYQFLADHDVLAKEQFGFRPGRSTEDQLLLTYDDITKNLDVGHVTDLILFDFSKAFDKVDHSILLQKLRCLRFGDQIFNWIRDFLIGRSMRVMAKDTCSEPAEVLSGVPQGSVLGPVLFLLFINHVAANLSCKYMIFADDLKVYTRIDPCDTSEEQANAFQEDVRRLNETADSWGLKMNLKKTVALRFRRRFHPVTPPLYMLGDRVIPVVSSQTDLGVIIDDTLKFHEHAQSAARKAGAIAHNLLKSTVCRSSDFMIYLLKAHIRPILEYASVVWNTSYAQDRRRLESVQRLWTRHVLGLEKKEYGERLKALDLFSVEGRMLRADLVKCWKIFHGHSPIQPSMLWDINNNARTRGHRFRIKVNRCEIDARARFFSNRIIGDWNSLPEKVAGADTLGKFKTGLAAVLGERLFHYTA